MRSTWVVALLATSLLCMAAPQSARGDLTPKEQVGKLLFFDTNLSTPFGQACAACHAPETAFVGPVSEINAHGAVYPGAVHSRFGNRKPPSSAYATFSPDFHYDEEEGLFVGGMFWDGRALNTVEQAKGPFLNPLEQNNPNLKIVVGKVARSAYAVLFQEVYGFGIFLDPVRAYDAIADAISAYEGSSEVNRFTSKYDYYLAGMVDLTEQEARGLMLFEGQANCAACHPSQPGADGSPPLFTDFTYDNLGIPKNPENPFYDMPPAVNPDGENWIDYGLGAIVGLPEEMGKMKVPTLRGVGMRPTEDFVQAYGHNGVFKSLHEIVDFYNTRDLGGWPPPEVPENVNTEELGNLGLTPEEVDDIVAFLETLTDGYVLGSEPGPSSPSDPGPIAARELLPFLPNPLRVGSVLQLQQPDGSPLDQVSVHDVNGRLVRLLSGRQAASWDSRDSSGRLLDPGVYFMRLQGTAVRTERIVLIP